MTEQFDEVLVQQYVPGREFNVGFVGNRTLAIAEIDFAGMPEGAWPILTHAAKWDRGSPEDVGSVPVCPANIPQRLAGALTQTAGAARRGEPGAGGGRGGPGGGGAGPPPGRPPKPKPPPHTAP